MKLNSEVTIKAGKTVGMKTLKADTPAKVVRLDQDVHGKVIGCVEWYDFRGDRRTTWVTESDIISR